MIPRLGELFGSGKKPKTSSASEQPAARKYSYVTIDDIVKIYSDKINETALNEELTGATIFVGSVSITLTKETTLARTCCTLKIKPVKLIPSKPAANLWTFRD